MVTFVTRELIDFGVVEVAAGSLVVEDVSASGANFVCVTNIVGEVVGIVAEVTETLVGLDAFSLAPLFFLFVKSLKPASSSATSPPFSLRQRGRLRQCTRRQRFRYTADQLQLCPSGTNASLHCWLHLCLLWVLRTCSNLTSVSSETLVLPSEAHKESMPTRTKVAHILKGGSFHL